MEARNRKLEAKIKNEKLVRELVNKRKTFCGVGTRKVKLMLNKLIKSGDINAQLYRLALEIEDKNIQAKDHKNYYYRDTIYYHKKMLIYDLIKLCSENNIVFGYHASDVRDTSNIIYFELPNTEQISFHVSLDDTTNIPIYEKEWDGLVCSTLDKLEKVIFETYLRDKD
ncbi:MAG: hypothetical protein IKT40_08790 [Bacilli bacterium]|nr:hypothetical protein [Bacilli bacterium]